MRHHSPNGHSIKSIGSVVSQSQPIFDLWILRLLINGGAIDYVDMEDSDYDFPNEGLLAPAAAVVEKLRKLHDKAQAAADQMAPSVRPSENGSRFGDWLEYCRACGVISEKNVAELDKSLTDALASAEKAFSEKAAFTEPLAGNLKRLQKLFALDDETILTLLFISYVLRGRGDLFFWVLRCFDCTGGYSFIAAISACATRTPLDTSKTLFTDADSPLRMLLDFTNGKGNPEWIDCWFDSVKLSLQHFFTGVMSEEELQSAFFKSTPNPTLTLSDFPHLPQVENTVLPYLKAAVRQRKPGVNILIYGAPGSGKTELTRVLGQTLHCRTFEISTISSANNDSRLNAWQAANTCLRSQESTLLVLDEAEDVFNDGLLVSSSQTMRKNKAKINKLLETNNCPTLWLTNSLANMDPAILRRFDIILESTTPTKEQRLAIIEKLVGGVFSAAMKARLAATAKLTPGVIARVKSVVEALDLAPEQRDQRALELVNDVLRVQNAGVVAPAEPLTAAVYSAGYVNTDVDLAALAAGLKGHPSARICLYGKPGTGKSAFAAHIAKTLGKPLLKKKASDLLDRYVGGTEALIATAFADATKKNAVLLIDEADSFLQDRSRSVHSWETTQVNEMLTQMESFEGVFIATTNLIDTMDAASLRRFDLKVKFDCLRPEQSLSLFRCWAEKLGISVTDAAASCVSRLDALAPGDFAAVVRQAQFRPLVSAEDFSQRLADECHMKVINAGGGNTIGFC